MTPIRFFPNQPQQLSLSDPSGEMDGDFYVLYPTSDGHTLRVSRSVAIQINELDLQPGESFWICKDQDKETGASSFRVWLATETEQARAAQEIATEDEPETELAGQLAASLKVVTKRKRPGRAADPNQPRLFDRKGTGTYGPAPLPVPAVASGKPQRIPFNVAFSEVTRFVIEGLKANGEQWNDQAKQDAICTILIAAAKQGLLCLWERGTNA